MPGWLPRCGRIKSKNQTILRIGNALQRTRLTDEGGYASVSIGNFLGDAWALSSSDIGLMLAD